MPFLYACEVVLNKILTHLFDSPQYFFFLIQKNENAGVNIFFYFE
jgi:hypothetical protein